MSGYPPWKELWTESLTVLSPEPRDSISELLCRRCSHGRALRFHPHNILLP